jgi:hypothetical protein
LWKTLDIPSGTCRIDFVDREKDIEMRTKTFIDGFKNSQKIRVMFEGFGVYTTVGGVCQTFATASHSAAACDALLKLSNMRYNAEKDGEPMPVGLGYTTRGMQVQIDLI